MLSHFASAALAMDCAIASGMFFWVTSPCALADDVSNAVMAKLAKALEIDGMSELPVDLPDIHCIWIFDYTPKFQRLAIQVTRKAARCFSVLIDRYFSAQSIGWEQMGHLGHGLYIKTLYRDEFTSPCNA
jgi:hypothetical protein